MSEPTRSDTPVDPTGEAVRRQLFGDEHYENSMSNTTPFEKEWQLFITNQVFGRTWGRGILQHQQLSLINLGMLAGLGRMEEFELHFRIALNKTKVPLIQLREIILHIAMYCGVPIARDCFVIARRVLKEEGVDLSVLETQEQEVAHGAK